MNRGWIIIAIVLGVTAAAGGATYFLTEKYGSADPLLEKLVPAGLNAPGSPAIPGPPPPPGPGAVQGAAADAGARFDQLFNSFDHRSQSLVWVLPPGIHAEGPFLAHVKVSHNDKVEHESQFPLTATRIDAGARPEFPAGSDVVRLSLDDTWPAKRDALKTMVEQMKAKYGPGGSELEIASDFKTRIDPERKREYCMQSDKIVIDLYIEDAVQKLNKVDISGALPILQRTIVTGGCIG